MLTSLALLVASSCKVIDSGCALAVHPGFRAGENEAAGVVQPAVRVQQARLDSGQAKLAFVQLSAVFSGVADLKRAFDDATKRRRAGQGTLRQCRCRRD